jgi:hypothetical protein
METDRVGDACGKGGNWKKNRLSWDPRRLNSNKRAERQDRLYIGIQEKGSSVEGLVCSLQVPQTDCGGTGEEVTVASGVVPTEGLAAEGVEVIPVIVGDVEWVRTPLVLRDLDSTDMPFAQQ